MKPKALYQSIIGPPKVSFLIYRGMRFHCTTKTRGALCMESFHYCKRVDYLYYYVLRSYIHTSGYMAGLYRYV